MKISEGNKGFCVFCRHDNKILSDEHVIPDCIGGIYHIYNVCTDCNSKLGETVDTCLTSHFFVEAKRKEYGLKGKTGKVPNILAGDGVLKDGTKVKLMEDSNGELTPYIIPSQPIVVKTDSKTEISFHIDIKDQKHIDQIKEKIYKRNGIDPSKHRIESKQDIIKFDRPEITMTASIDLFSYKMGLLKIAYEYTCDIFPSYIDDPRGREYAQILLNCDLERLRKVKIADNGFDAIPFKDALGEVIDFENKNRHYLLLMNFDGKLYCYVSIFDTLCGLIEMSDKEYVEKADSMHIVINDYINKTLIKDSLYGLINRQPISVFTGLHFNQKESEKLDSNFNIGFGGFISNLDGDTLIYKQDNISITTINGILASYDPDKVETKCINKGEFRHLYQMPKGLFVKVWPKMDLIELESVEMFEKRQLY